MSEIPVGAKVTFFVVRQFKRTTHISQREGEVLSIHDDKAVVLSKKRRLRVPADRLRLIGAPSAITEAFLSAAQTLAEVDRARGSKAP